MPRQGLTKRRRLLGQLSNTKPLSFPMFGRGEVTRFADVPNPDMGTGIEVMGSEMAVDEAQDAFNGAWIACGSVIDTMPAVMGDEYQSSWDDIGINLAMIFM